MTERKIFRYRERQSGQSETQRVERRNEKEKRTRGKNESRVRQKERVGRN